MTYEKMIKAIYKEIANKELSFECRIKDELGEEYIFWKMCESGNSFDTINSKGKFNRFIFPMDYNEIIGHPVLIGDILDWIDKNMNWVEVREGWREKDMDKHQKLILTIYNYFIGRYRLPIEKQETQTIKFIYNLITGNQKNT